MSQTQIITGEKTSPELEKLAQYIYKTGTLFANYSINDFQLAANSQDQFKLLQDYFQDPGNQLLYMVCKNKKKEDLENNSEPNIILASVIDGMDITGSQIVLFYKKQNIMAERMVKDTRYPRNMINAINLGYIHNDFTPLQVFHEYVKGAFLPMFNNLKSALNRDEGSHQLQLKQRQESANAVFKILSEVETNVSLSTQASVVPKVDLSFDIEIVKLCKEAALAGQDPCAYSMNGPLFDDSQWIISLAEQANQWTYQISKLSDFHVDKKVQSLSSEINFWNSLNQNVQLLYKDMQRPEVKLTFYILKMRNRTTTTVFELNKNLENRMLEIEKIDKIMKDIPHNQILLANDIQEIKRGIVCINEQLKKLFEIGYYTTGRFRQLQEILKGEIKNQILDILRKSRVLDMDFAKIQELAYNLNSMLQKWDQSVNEFKKITSRFAKQGDFFGRIGQQDYFRMIQKRFEKIQGIKGTQQGLKTVVEQIFEGDINFIEELHKHHFPTQENMVNVLDLFTNIDLWDLSENGDRTLDSTITTFQQHIQELEVDMVRKIIIMLRESKNNQQKFTVLSNFSSLIQRPYLRQELKQQQEQLLKIIEEDQNKLIGRYKARAERPPPQSFLQKLKLPQGLYSIVWLEQVRQHLTTNIERVRLILGDNWQETIRGKEIAISYNNFLVYLQQNLSDTIQGIIARYETKPNERLFHFQRSLLSNKVEMQINMSPELLSLIKSMKFLLQMIKELNKKILLKYMFGKVTWPAYISTYTIKDNVMTFNRVAGRINTRQLKLLNNLLREVYKKIETASKHTWFDEKSQDGGARIEQLSVNLAKDIRELEIAQIYLQEKLEIIDQLLQGVNNYESPQEIIIENVKAIQVIVQEFETRQFDNIDSFIEDINTQIKNSLIHRMESISKRWAYEYVSYSGDANSISQRMKNDNVKKFIQELINLFGELPLQKKYINETTLLYIKVQYQNIFLDPPIEHCKMFWLTHLQGILSQISATPIIRQQSNNNTNTGNKQTFSNIFDEMESGTIINIFEMIQEHLDLVSQEVSSWQRYQALWEMDIQKVSQLLGNSTLEWENALNDIKNGKIVFEAKAHAAQIGPITINFKTARKKINNKYDGLHKEILDEFGKCCHEKTCLLFEEVKQQREKTEQVDLTNSLNIISGIKTLNTCRQMYDEWKAAIKKYKTSEELLVEQGFTFPTHWKDYNMIKSEWNRFQQTFKAKQDIYQKEYDIIKGRLLKEEETLLQRIKDIQQIWKIKKPFSGSMHPKSALQVLDNLEKLISDNRTSFEKLNQAKELLRLSPLDLGTIRSIDDETSSLRELWGYLSDVWQQVDKILEIPIRVSSPVKMGQCFDDIIERLGALPQKFMSYEVLVMKKKEISNYKKTNKLLREIHTEAIKESHWELILQKIRLFKKYKLLTFNDLHKHNFVAYEKVILEIVSVAQGELILENIIKKIKDFWSYEEFQMAQYQQKCKLIKGWDDLMTKIEDDLAQLGSMKLSQHYPVFEQEIKIWNEKLVTVQNILEVWVNVQRKWVYLEGIFFGSSDISRQLPREYSRFRTHDSEFVSLMRKCSSKLKILEIILNTPNLLKSLQLLYDQLEKIQKALSDYLEVQRQAFARFYFVGDEDLLEIIGNCKTVNNIQKYFSKMFAGINWVESEKEGTQLVGMRSREFETVPFDKHFNIIDHQKIDQWLTQLELQMKLSLASFNNRAFLQWNNCGGCFSATLAEKTPAQVLLSSFCVFWTFSLEDGKSDFAIQFILNSLNFLAEEVLNDIPKLQRQKYEQIITEFVHKRDITRMIIQQCSKPKNEFIWLSQMRFYKNYELEEGDLVIKMGESSFDYGYEYLGVSDKLVQTPLTDKCYYTMTQALWLRMGGAPFGPAGTGKTESVKALGSALGRFVLVFNCDETFNFKAMGRIFIGLAQVGAWGCFDEFNRLEEKILSAVSQQILVIQIGLREGSDQIELMGRDVKINQKLGIFITMNPGYAGRSNLPENLKQLFRQMAMIRPDRQLIAQVMLFSQGFRSAEHMSSKIVSLFELCNDQLSFQPHYDFGLRALKSVLNSAGQLKRVAINSNKEQANQGPEEQSIILRSFCDTVIPKLISDDAPLLQTLIKGVFPDANIPKIRENKLRLAIGEECHNRMLLQTDQFVEKVFQLHSILQLHHGVMMVGSSGSGKTMAWRVLLSAMSRIDNCKGEYYIIDPKAINKQELYGKLDNTTMEWTDGIFTSVLRKIYENTRGESSKRHWIIFDGDVDPEWAENLNSVLDDNKLLTLPNGERIAIPSNVKIMFEVESLKFATPATVSRCGMIWFSEDTLLPPHIFYNYTLRLKQSDFDDIFLDNDINEQRFSLIKEIEPLIFGSSLNQLLSENNTQIDIAPHNSLLWSALLLAHKYEHVMDFSSIRAIESFFTLFRKGLDKLLESQNDITEASSACITRAKYLRNWFILCINWAFSGDTKLQKRTLYFQELLEAWPKLKTYDLPLIDERHTLIDYTIDPKNGNYIEWKALVPHTEVSSDQVNNADIIITTVDTMRHQLILCSWLLQKKPFIICGPPGSGKTMTLLSTLRNLPNYDMVFVNFSSSTKPNHILKQFEHYCEYTKSSKGLTLKPKQLNRNLVVFCDEINLPDEDCYGTQTVITFLRQLTEQKGFWRNSDKQWVHLEKIQFVGACNPPTDVGRHPLAKRFLRHCPLILVDFPGYESLTQIYGSFNQAMLSPFVELKKHWQQLTKAMIEFYSQSQKRFTTDQQAHYIYSPRELTRWKYAINEAIDGVADLDELVRLWAHEALRLFEDRLVYEEEREWCQQSVDRIAQECFPTIDIKKVLQRPILFSSYLSKSYKSVEVEELRKYVIEKLKVFNEEEYQIQLVVFDSVLDHIVRIDRVLRQPIGHLLLVGQSGVGKTTLSRYVAWMNGLSVYQIRAGREYTIQDFDDNLREVMRRAGCKGECICFIFDESNILSPAFMERMNALLASGEIPGLFEGDEFVQLINQYKENIGGKLLQNNEEIYASFTRNVQRNLHVIFTMNPVSPDFSNRAASSPAIFNRCVIDWFGDWSREAFYQVAMELTERLEVFPGSVEEGDLTPSDVLVQAIVKIHESVASLNKTLRANAKTFTFITPRDFLDFIHHVTKLQIEKSQILIDQEGHLRIGLEKLNETEQSVQKLDQSLKSYQIQLNERDQEANKKMELIMEEQKSAEEQQAQLSEMSIILESKKKEIDERTMIVQADLEKAGPALEKAKKAVSSISRKELDDIRVLIKPPEPVQTTMSAVCQLMSGNEYTWNEIQKVMKASDFISKVLNLNVDGVKDIIKNRIMKIINSDKWNLDRIFHCYKAAGVLATWLESQLKYADILKKVDPLRKEITILTTEQENLLSQQQENQHKLKTIKQNIEDYKNDYQALITQVENIKSEMGKVSGKVEKSKRLLNSLSSEQVRWSESSHGFTTQLQNIIGKVLIGASFITYSGFYDQHYRGLLMKTWCKILSEVKLKQQYDLSILEFLSTPSERMHWVACGLSNDDLYLQNAIITKRFNKYPLVIDPTGQAATFLLRLFHERKIEKTAFDEPNFMKQLEKCLRFGLPLLLTNVHRMEPMMNGILNREIIKQGGRRLVRVADQEIDFNNNFILFMLTSDPEAHFSPDLCSRVTFVNFTITKSSLEDQCINLYLRKERPDIEKDRVALLKLQGEYLLKMRESEDELLAIISEQQGNLLDNDALIITLENIKERANELQEKMSQSAETLKRVEAVTEEYRSLANISARLYFIMTQLSSLNNIYQFSYAHYIKIVMLALEHNPLLDNTPSDNYGLRIKAIQDQLLLQMYKKTEVCILEQDKILIQLKLCQLLLSQKQLNLLNYFYQPQTILKTTWEGILENSLKNWQLIILEQLSQLQEFKNLQQSLIDRQYDWLCYKNDNNANMPLEWISEESEIERLIIQILVSKALNSQKCLDCIRELIKKTLTPEFSNYRFRSMEEIAMEDSENTSPIFIITVAGFDPSFKIDQLSKSNNKKIESVAIGSPEGFIQAERLFDRAIKQGSWLVFKNVHLACHWLTDLEQRLLKHTTHKDFRLFLVSEFSDKLPSTLLRSSVKIIFELPDGIKPNVQRTFSSLLPKSKLEQPPNERIRLYFHIFWLHSVIMERLRYIPIGWSKAYEFSEADLKCSIDILDQFLLKEATPLSHLKALRSIITNNIYGGKIDNDFDLKILKALVDQHLNDDIQDKNHYFVKEGNKVIIDNFEAINFNDYLNWITNLKIIETPIWAGLPEASEKVLLRAKLNKLQKNLSLLQNINDEEFETILEDDENEESSKVKWLGELSCRCRAYLNMLPKKIPSLIRSEVSILDPLFRFLERECILGQAILKQVTSNLNDILGMAEGTFQTIQEIKNMASLVYSGTVPLHWRKYTTPDINISTWLQDFASRLQQLIRISEMEEWWKRGVQIGLFFFPEAFLTATRQFVAQRQKLSLDELELRIQLTQETNVDDNSFLATQLVMEGVKWTQAGLFIEKELSFPISLLLCSWVHVDAAQQKCLQENQIFLPFYLNSTRKQLITQVKFKIDTSKITEQVLYQKGIGLILWNM